MTNREIQDRGRSCKKYSQRNDINMMDFKAFDKAQGNFF